MVYGGVVTCPYCGYEGIDFKLDKEWAHGLHLVDRFVCPICNNVFRFYWGEKLDGTAFHYIMKKK